MDHHHADVKMASKVRFAEPGAAEGEDAPSPPLTDTDDKDKDDKVNIFTRVHTAFGYNWISFWSAYFGLGV